MKEADVLRCQIQEWYPRFRTRSIKTQFVQLPEEFVSYLLEDGLYLPEDSDAMPRRTQVREPQLQADGYSEWDDDDDDDDEGDAEARSVPTFPELAAEVEAAIEGLGGAVLPKLNWSAPKDTAWIATTGSMKCQSFGEVALLLKASDNVVHDLCNAFDACEDKSRERPARVVLALRKWYDVRPEMEFRAFVRQNTLLAVCQREVTGFYEALLGREAEISDLVSDFFLEHLRDEFGGGDYTFDVYVTKENKVKLVDFNTWRGSTLPLLFTWEELEERAAEALNPRVDFRIVTSEGLVQLGLRVGTGVPIDFVNQGAWEDIIKREAEREAREAEKDRAGA